MEIFLWEKDVETAWTEEQKGGCSESLWLQLAKARETEWKRLRNFIKYVERKPWGKGL